MAFQLSGFDLSAFVRDTLDEDLGEGLAGGGRDVTSESVIPAEARFAGVMDTRDAIREAAAVGLDLVEVSPPFDASGNTAFLGVTVMFELLCAMLAGRG